MKLLPLILVFAAQDEKVVVTRESAVNKGVRLLLERQRDDGSWGWESTFGRDVNIRSAITLFCIRALEACGEHTDQEKKAIESGIKFVAENAFKRPDKPSYGMYDFSFYSCSYALAYFSKLKRPDLKNAVDQCLRVLQENQREDGGFTYLFPGRRDNYESFTTALVILNNLEAQKNGLAIPKEINARALGALTKSRTPDEYFCYHMIEGKQRGSVSGNGKLALEGSLVRTLVCEYALHKLGEGKKELLKKSIDHFFTHRQGLEDVRKKDRKTHQGPFDNAPYYFLFGHVYAALALKELDKDFRKSEGKKLEEIFMAIREEDGSWMDGRITGKDYGIAMGLLVLDLVKTSDEY
jgi:hypothetical protein